MTALRFAFALLVLASGSFFLSAQDRSYGRSVVATQYGIVATSQVAASQAGARALEQGGSAIDAAIAANAVLNVMEPTSNGLGGDLFVIYWEAKTGKLYGLNASGWAPKALTIEHLRAKGVTEMPQYGDRLRDRAGRGGGRRSSTSGGENCLGAICFNRRFFTPITDFRWGTIFMRLLGGRSQGAADECGERVRFLPGGNLLRRGDFSQSGCDACVPVGGGARRERLLQGRYCEGDSEDLGRTGRNDDGGGSCVVFRRVG